MIHRLDFRSALVGAGFTAIALLSTGAAFQGDASRPAATEMERSIRVQYLEIVSRDVEATCDNLEKLHGVTFSAPVAALGNARTAALSGGGRIGVRAPMHAAEEPVVRPYVLVDDIEAAAGATGGEIAHPPLELPGHGTFAIYVQGGNQHGLWQL